MTPSITRSFRSAPAVSTFFGRNPSSTPKEPSGSRRLTSATQPASSRKPASKTEFLAIYGRINGDAIRHNRSNVAERPGFLGRLIYAQNRRAWSRELKARLGETVAYADV